MIHCFGKKYQSSGISLNQKNDSYHSGNHIEIYYLISGSAQIFVDGKEQIMNQGAIVLFNFNDEKSFQPQMDDSTFFVCISLANELFYENAQLFFPQFDCNSVIDNNNLSYKKIRESLESLIDEAISNDLRNEFKLLEAAFAFLDTLVRSFLVEADNQKKETQIQQLLAYIHENAANDLSLTKIAEHFYLNPSYLSRLFKKEQGIGFQEYLSSYRLSLSESELIYTDKHISMIALDVGFKNVNVYLKNFKRQYGMTPKEFREKNRVSKGPSEPVNEDERSFLKEWLYSDKNSAFTGEHHTFDYLQASEKKSAPIQMINLGCAADILQSDYRKQIRFLKEELDFRYGRVWNLFVEEMNVDVNRIKDINFDRIDSVLDFLLELEIKPFIELGYKIRRIYKNVKLSETPLFSQPSYELVNEDWRNLLTRFIEHVEKRYGQKEIGQWHFELTRDEKDLNEYAKQYQTTYSVLKANNQNIKVGGAGFKYNYDQIPLKDELSYFESKKMSFDFLSFMSFPYERRDKSQRHSKRITDLNYLKQMTESIQRIKHASSFRDVPIYLTEWGNTISSRNKINDTLYKGCYIVKGFTDLMANVALIGHWIASDLYSNFVDSKQLLNGGNGMLNKNGIPKPFFFALDFLFSLSTNIVYRKGNCVISVKNGSKIIMLIHNAKTLNYRHSMIPENEISYQDVNHMFVENEDQTFQIRFCNLPQKKWKIKVNTVNEENGNLLKEWESIGFGTDIGREEINYLQRVTIPKLSYYIDSGADISIERTLTPNEFCLIEIMKD